MEALKQVFALSMSTLLVFSPVITLADNHEEMIDITSDWQGSVFGNNGGQDGINSENFEIKEDDSTVTLRSSNDKGKIESNAEGIAYYFKNIPKDANVEMTATAEVSSWTANDQVGFGIMLRSNVLDNENIGDFTGDYIAAGALDQSMKGFYNQNDLDSVVKEGYEFDEANTPAPDEKFKLKLEKNGGLYRVSVGDETQVIEDFEGEVEYAGLFTSRNTEVTYSNVSLEVEEQKDMKELQVDSSDMKTEYLVEEELDTKGLRVTAVDENGEEELTSKDYIVTGFDSSEPGTNTMYIHYNGVVEAVDLSINDLSVTDMEVQFLPAKTTYYPGDMFDYEGLTIMGEFNDGYQTRELSSDEYTIVIDGDEVKEGDTLEKPGMKDVTVVSKENSEVAANFQIEVVDAKITGLYIRQDPEKTTYFIGNELQLDGIVVYAEYSDGNEVRLIRDSYEVSPLDTSTEGEKQIEIAHKGEKAQVNVTVKEKEVTGLEVTNYPQTTYDIDEELNMDGLEVSEVYDNGDRQVLNENKYEVNAEQYDASSPGVTEISVHPKTESLDPASFKVTTRAAKDQEWNSRIFGQSVGEDTNTVNVNDEGTVDILAEGPSSGKITGDHDGITYYYTEIDAEQDNFELSADIHVNNYAKEPHDGQESFGIMARDAIGEPNESSVFASNVAAVGGYSGGTTAENGTQLFVRTGVESSDGSGSEGIQKTMLDSEKPNSENTYPETDYKLTLAKTNSGYTGKINDGEEELLYEPEILNVQDDKMYVGFYAARVAHIEVSNIDLNVTAAETDEPKVDPPTEPTEPSMEVLSLEKSSKTNDYEVMLRSNVDGTVNLKQGTEIIAKDNELEAGEITVVETPLEENESTNFTSVFLPDDTQTLTSYDQIITNFSVTNRTFDGDIYVSPEGTGSGQGTEENPVDLDTAVDYVSEGQTIIVTDGEYVRESKLEMKKYNDGTEDAMKILKAAPDATPVIDFDKQSEGVVLSGDYWHVEGIDFARSAGNTKGFVIGGDNNIVENSRFYEHGDTGLQISRTDSEEDDKSEWPSNNLVLNSTSFDNRDPSENNADGFAAKLTSGEGNVFRGTIAHNNIDDGWDLYTKVGTGEIGSVLIEDSIAYHNGFLTDGTQGSGDKNGFKLGGEGVNVPHVIRNSIAFDNGAVGFTSNSNPGVIAQNNVSFNNAGGNLDFSTYPDIDEAFELENFVSYQHDYQAEDVYPESLESETNYLYDGSSSVNSSGVELTEEDFASTNPDFPYKRDVDGDIVWGDFLEFKK
ncbi:hypothetical protein J2S78_002645 [Salibacterium salarium]|uniref:bacterial Ig-like domain-containing protein n=1 Tax=Salibacterium salarium TaxID=284579 RepID=UPI00277F5F04|nr:bacterial Ig-like domain-containing protein [Salibacterium salarium]MDQ0300198.1 hypothetical protein [Salibacterium salarium]